MKTNQKIRDKSDSERIFKADEAAKIRNKEATKKYFDFVVSADSLFADEEAMENIKHP